MKNYLAADVAQDILERIEPLDYPQAEQNLVNFPPIGSGNSPYGKELTTAPPSKLLSEAVGYFDDGQEIIDIGCGFAVNSLYLAAQGHRVTAIDPDPDGLEFARERARAAGIPNGNIDFKRTSLFELPSGKKYGGVLAQMVLHFLPSEDIEAAVGKIQAITDIRRA